MYWQLVHILTVSQGYQYHDIIALHGGSFDLRHRWDISRMHDAKHKNPI